MTRENSCRELTVLSCTPGTDPTLVDLVLSPPGWSCRAGQFVMIRPVHWKNEIIWPRPFSICDISPAGLRIFFQIVGRGTEKLARLQPGQKVAVWGPLGRGFQPADARPNLILAGGMGIAPFVMMARARKTEDLSILFGHRLDLRHYPYAEIARHIPGEAMQQKTAEDLTAFEQVLSERIKALAGKGQVLACGPNPMLKVVRKYCLQHGTDGQISLENRMACGVGACLGCVGKTTAGEYVQSCVHGPVFDVCDIDLEA